jgi:hypothetical protein
MSKPCTCSWSAWSLVTVRVMVSPTPSSIVRGAGVTRLPRIVTATVRWAGELEDGGGALDEDGADEDAADEDGAVTEGLVAPEDVPDVGAAPPPQAATPATRATHPAYRRIVGHVILVTIRSLDRPF